MQSKRFQVSVYCGVSQYSEHGTTVQTLCWASRDCAKNINMCLGDHPRFMCAPKVDTQQGIRSVLYAGIGESAT